MSTDDYIKLVDQRNELEAALGRNAPEPDIDAIKTAMRYSSKVIDIRLSQDWHQPNNTVHVGTVTYLAPNNAVQWLKVEFPSDPRDHAFALDHAIKQALEVKA